MHDPGKVYDNNKDSPTLGLKSKIAGVDAEIAGLPQVIYEALTDMPKNEYGDSNDTSYEENYEISNVKESHNEKISSEDAYHPNVHPKSTTLSQQR